MTNHPYRISPLTDDSSSGGGQGHCTHTCLACRTRAGLARVRLRSVLLGGAAFAFLMVNVATALVTFTSARLAEKMLAAATSLDRATHDASTHVRKGARGPEHHQAPPRTAPAAAPAPPPRPPLTRVDWHFEQPHTKELGILRIGPSEYVVDRPLVDRVLEGQAEMMTTTRIVPETKAGKVVGVKVFGVAPDTLLSMLGFENGDTLETVNGFDLSSPDAALEAYARLRMADELTVRLKRRGAPLVIRYHIR
jgi:hypothetical protein